MKKIVMLSMLVSSVFANVDIKNIDIYKNINFVKQKIDTNNTSQVLLSNIQARDIKFLKPQDCKITNFEIINEKADDELSKLILELKNKITYKQNRIKSLKSNIDFLQKTSLSSISNSKMLEESSSFLKKEVLNNYNSIYELENFIKEDKKELNTLIMKRGSQKVSILNYKTNCKDELFIYYPIYNIKKSGKYDINYNSQKKNIEIKNSYFITQSSGYDFKNIDINLYNYSYFNQIKPNKFYPYYLDKKQEIAFSQPRTMSKKVMNESLRSEDAVPSYKYNEDTTRSYFTASNVSLESGKKEQIVFSNDLYKGKDSLEIDGYSSSKAFYKVEFKSDKFYGTVNSELYIDNKYIGRSNFNEIKKDKETNIYFSTNSFIDIKKELVKDMKEEPFFSLNKLKTQKIWKYEVSNNSKQKQTINLLERVPVSKHEDIEVKVIGSTKASKLEKNGKIHFNFQLKPNEKKTIEFGYEILKPNKN